MPGLLSTLQVYMGAELDERPKQGLVTQTVSKVVMTFAKQVRSSKQPFHPSWLIGSCTLAVACRCLVSCSLAKGVHAGLGTCGEMRFSAVVRKSQPIGIFRGPRVRNGNVGFRYSGTVGEASRSLGSSPSSWTVQ